MVGVYGTAAALPASVRGVEGLMEGREMAENPPEYYYNLDTGEVEEGLVSGWTQRIGPYPTREAAQHALDTAARRNDTWDEADRAWRGDD
jgi:hypothetical protein